MADFRERELQNYLVGEWSQIIDPFVKTRELALGLFYNAMPHAQPKLPLARYLYISAQEAC